MKSAAEFLCWSVSPLAPVESGDSDVWEAVGLGWVKWLMTGRKEWVVRGLRSFQARGEGESMGRQISHTEDTRL